MSRYAVISFVLCAGVYALTRHTLAGWALLAAWWLMLLAWATLTARWWPARFAWIGLLAGLAGAGPVVLAQIEGRFSDEEFFAALQAILLCGEWLMLWGGVTLIRKRWLTSISPRPVPRFLALALITGTAAGGVLTLILYQHSFYPPVAPAYPGISMSNPFLCGAAPPEAQTYDGQDIFNRLLARVEANPRKGPPEYGMLALAQHSAAQAQLFREALLAEAQAGKFAQPANSVKFIQYEAAFRVYYYSRVRAAYPDLFSVDDEALLHDWFAAINRRALTVEWVDWMYASALGEWPTGPYENQENGAGLLALLEQTDLAAPELAAANRAYLQRLPRGWAARFRNTDDAFIYQPEWINNALFQGGQTANTPLSFDWLLTQALPDGAGLRYNHAATGTLAGVAYLGATLTGDPRYLWLAGRTVEALESTGGYLFAQPGVETPTALKGQAPATGSCLLYGDSGLPNQRGPLAPDKIILRDGWSADDAYLLLNLRFTGWHRYKATNTLALIYQGQPLMVEDNNGAPSTWLPIGRSLFRDKRIPRENLNGLLVGRTGVDSVVSQLTGIGGPWAQDPPYYAEVQAFETGAEFDYSRTVLRDWHGWTHTRSVYLYHHGGPVVVIDDAEGPPNQRAALAWHLAQEASGTQGRYMLRGGEHPVEMVMVSDMDITQQAPATLWAVMARGHARLATVFLFGEWSEAEVSWSSGILEIIQAERSIYLPSTATP